MQSKQRVLVVDDDRLVADTLALIFQGNGFECEARYSAMDGLERARTFAPQLVLCDVTMPDVDGLVLAEAVAVEMPACRVLMFTGYSANVSRVAERSASLPQPLRLLSKPCRPEILLREANSLLREA